MTMGTGLKTSGGEGGIRTLDTGVSPYNGLAIEWHESCAFKFKHIRACDCLRLVLNVGQFHLK
jgi:hypothetical protein